MLQEIPWGELLEAIFRRRRILAVVAVVVFGATLLSVGRTPPSFRAAARIQLTADPASGPRAAAMSDKQLQAELAFLRSPVLIGRVLAKLGEGEQSAEPRSGRRHILLRVLGSMSRRIARLRGRSGGDQFEHRVQAAAASIEVEPIGRSNLVEIACLSSSPAFAADFVNGLLTEHVERIAELGRESPELPFIEAQLDGLVERWQEARQALDAFRSDYGASILSGDETRLRSLVSGLEAKRVEAETNVHELKARVAYLEGQKLEYPATVESELRLAEPEAVKALETRITELQMERSEALTRYTPTSVFVRQLERQIEEAERLLATKEREAFSESATARNPAVDALEVEQLKTMAELSTVEARVEALSGQIATYRGKLKDLEVAVVQLERLQNDVDSAQEAYQSYLREAETARKESAREEFGMVNIAIIEPAEPPRIAEPSRARLEIAAGGVLGLLLGLLAALLRDWLDPSVKSAAQVRRLTGLRVLAEIPYQ